MAHSSPSRVVQIRVGLELADCFCFEINSTAVLFACLPPWELGKILLFFAANSRRHRFSPAVFLPAAQDRNSGMSLEHPIFKTSVLQYKKNNNTWERALWASTPQTAMVYAAKLKLQRHPFSDLMPCCTWIRCFKIKKALSYEEIRHCRLPITVLPGAHTQSQAICATKRNAWAHPNRWWKLKGWAGREATKAAMADSVDDLPPSGNRPPVLRRCACSHHPPIDEGKAGHPVPRSRAIGLYKFAPILAYTTVATLGCDFFL